MKLAVRVARLRSAGALDASVFEFIQGMLLLTQPALAKWQRVSLATAIVVYFSVRKGLRAALPSIRAWIRNQRESYMTWKISRAQTVGVLGIVLLLFVPPRSNDHI